MRPSLWCLSAVLLVCSPCFTQMPAPAAAVRQTEFAQIQAEIPAPPTAFRGAGLWHLCYEIHFTNLASSIWTLQNISVSNEAGAPLLDVRGPSFVSVLYHPARPPDAQAAPIENLAPGETVIAYIWIDLHPDSPTPTQLHHQLTVRKLGESTSISVDSATTSVLSELPQIVSPLRGNNWVAGSGPSNSSPHRREIIVYGGKPYIAQRYAIDWVQFGDDNKTYKGDPRDNRSYHCFGLEAHAIADATVVEVKDGIPENVPNEKPAVPINLATVAGNHVNLDLGGGVYAMYAHLQPGSIRVKVGDRVTAGQVIGLLGNTGNSSEPHLHFQLMNRNSPLGSDGLPYSFAGFYDVGKMTIEGSEFKLNRASPQARHGEMPMENQIINFEP